jgi:D-alanyl-D-alanine carboxypeptidase (penicillin-binding protein 5/6)
MKGAFLGIGLAALAVSLPAANAEDMTVNLEQPFCKSQAPLGDNKREQPSFSLHAQSAVLMDAETGRILYEKDGETKRPMASTTKIMTCILALEEGNPEDLVEISAYAASMPDVQLGIREGEKYYLKDLLYSLMLESHNDSAAAVAEHIGGSVEKFADLMNQKARDIGCADTCFVTPNGLDKVRESDQTPHSTTAADLAEIMRYCIQISPKKEEFLELTRTASHSFSDQSGTRSFYCGNHNAFLTMMPEALTGKTGFTGAAGYCYIGAVKEGEKTFIAALLGCGWPPHKTYKWEDMKRLSSYALKEYEYREIYDSTKTFPQVKVENGVKDTVSLEIRENTRNSLRVLMREGEQPSVRYEYPRELSAPVEKGEPVGKADYYLGETLLSSYPVCAAESVEENTVWLCLKKCLSLWMKIPESTKIFHFF